MKRYICALLFCVGTLSAILAQTTIDKPAATIKLTKQEVISVRQFKADVDKIEGVIGRKLTAEESRQYLDSKVDMMLFVQYCDREGIRASDAEVLTLIGQMKSQLQLPAGADDAKLDIALKSQGVLLDARTYARQQLLLKGYLQAKKSDELKAIKEPTADDVLKAYELYKSQLVRPDTVRASVIYVDIRNLGADDKKKSIDAIRQVASQIKANPSRYDEFMLRSQDKASLLKATSSFYVEKTPQMVSVYGNQFMDAVFRMKVGDVSDLIENEAGLQLVRVNEVLPQKLLTLSDPYPGVPNATVQEYITYVLATQKQNDVLAKIQADLHTTLRKEATVKIYEENLTF